MDAYNCLGKNLEGCRTADVYAISILVWWLILFLLQSHMYFYTKYTLRSEYDAGLNPNHNFGLSPVPQRPVRAVWV